MKNNFLKITTIICSLNILPNLLLANTETTANGQTIYADVYSGEDDTGAYKGVNSSVDGSRGDVAVGANTYDGQSSVYKSVYTEKVSVDKNVTKNDDGTIYKDFEVMGSKGSISVAKDSDGEVSKTVTKGNPYEPGEATASVTKVKSSDGSKTTEVTKNGEALSRTTGEGAETIQTSTGKEKSHSTLRVKK